MRNCVAAVEPCSTGCTLMGPVDDGLRLGITDNSLLPSWFRRLAEKGACSLHSLDRRHGPSAVDCSPARRVQPGVERERLGWRR
jgi:hypothetical protein